MDDQQAITIVRNELTWFQKHERIVLVFMVLLAGVWLGNKYLNNAAADAQTKYGIAQSELSQSRLQAKMAKDDYQMTLDALTKQNAALAGAIATRNTLLQQKQTEIKTLPLPEVGSEWQRLIGGQGDIVSSTTGLTINDAGARRTVIQLEQVPVLTANLKDTQTVADNRLKELDKAGILITGLNKQLVDTDSTCKLQVAAVKASARKSKRTWFLIGFAAGIGTRILAHF